MIRILAIPFWFLGIIALSVCPRNHVHIICKYLLQLLGVSGSVSGKDCFDKIRDQHHRAVVVYNHPTFYDYLVIVAGLEEPVRLVAKDSYLSGLKWLARRFRMVLIHQGKTGHTEKLQKAFGEDFGYVAIAPTAGRSLETPDILPEFRTGAFVHECPVVPVVIRYDPYENWSNQSLLWVIRRRIFGPVQHYQMHVLDPVLCKDGESPSERAERTRNLMQDALRDIIVEPRPIQHNVACLMTIQLFLVAATRTAYYGCIWWTISILFTYLVSLAFHWNPDASWRTLDLSVNLTQGWINGILLVQSQQWWPLLGLGIAALNYILWTRNRSEAWQAFGVHLPIAISFWCLTK